MTGYILGLSRGHNAAVCLLKDGEVVFAIEEERLSRKKYDGGPYAGVVKVLEYTDKVDYVVMAHTQPEFGNVEFSGDTVFEGLVRKLKLVDNPETQIIDVHREHHKMHAACAFYRSGFEEAVALVVDGAGTFIDAQLEGQQQTVWEIETIFDCEYPNTLNTKYRHLGGRGPFAAIHQMETEQNNNEYELIIDESAGITKAYEAVTQYCGWSSIEAGKTMGLFPYGKPNDKLPKIYDNDAGKAKWTTTNRDLIIPTYPNGAVVNFQKYDYLNQHDNDDVTLLENRRDMAYAVQTQSQQQMLDLINKAVEVSGKKKVVISGGYGLNCVANYWYLDKLPEDVEIYVEPISNDAGTALGAAYYWYHSTTKDTNVRDRAGSLYLGPKYNYLSGDFDRVAKKYDKVEITNDVEYADIIKLLREKNIVTMYQGRSENGPRALGNRSVLFDPTFKDGKDFVNEVKRREYFRPFAASVLEEDAKDWFDLRGMDKSPHMMYAVDCQDGVAEKVPSVIHVDGTCRIQTVSKEENEHYYNLISEFKKETGVPLLFNTSFNLGGDPLVETLEDALDTLSKSDIEYCYFPEYKKLVKVPNN